VGDLLCDDALAQLEAGDAVNQQASGFGPFLVYDDCMTAAGELFGYGDAGRTAADYRYTTTSRGWQGWRGKTVVLALPVGAESLAFADIDRPGVAGDGAGALAEHFLRAKPPANFREIRGEAKNIGSIVITTLLDGKQRLGDVIMDRAAQDARLGGRTVDAAGRFDNSLLLAIPQKDRLEILDPLSGVLLRSWSVFDVNALPAVGVKVESLRVIGVV